MTAPPDARWPDLHLTLDTAEDYAMLKALYEGLYPQKSEFTVQDVIAYLKAHPEVLALNHKVARKKSQSEYFADVSAEPL